MAIIHFSFHQQEFKMTYTSVITHMNDHHTAELAALVKKYGNVKEVNDATLLSVDDNGLDIGFNGGEKLRVEFLKPTTQEGLKEAIIALCKTAQDERDFSRIKEQFEEFMRSFNSVCLATANKQGEVLCSYAPFVTTPKGNFIYVSEVSEHFDNLTQNPTNIEVMFLEDECKAAAVIFRKRLRYRATASLVERGAFFDEIFDTLEANIGGGAIKTIRNLLDFHLIELKFGKGRFVKGPGQAYDIDGEKVTHATAGANGNPHKFPHK